MSLTSQFDEYLDAPEIDPDSETEARYWEMVREQQELECAEEEEATEDVPQLPVTAIPYEGALQGLGGRIVRKLAPHTEGHPMAALAQIFVYVGNNIGRAAHFEIEDTPHYLNFFVAKCGATGKARKGTTSSRVAKIFKIVDPIWYAANVVRGLSTGEGLIARIQDEVQSESGKTIVEGVLDKRLCVVESEFARVLQVAKRDGSTLTSVLRSAWDGEDLSVMTKASIYATDPHVSVIADITIEELNQTITFSDKYNGMANRFLWVLMERCGLKPHGGDALDWTAEAAELKLAIKEAKKRKRVFWDRNARLKWERVYPQLSEGRPGVFGAVTSRAEAQTIRLALMYAMLDRSEHIRVEHLNAALAFWKYCEESARIIFGGFSAEQKKIAEALKLGALTAAQIRIRVFAKHRKMAEVLADLQGMVASGCADVDEQGRYVWLAENVRKTR